MDALTSDLSRNTQKMSSNNSSNSATGPDIIKMYYSLTALIPESKSPRKKLKPLFKNIKHRYKIGECIGQGCHSNVFYGKKKSSGKEFAIKVIHSSQMTKPRLKALLHEAEVQN